MASEPTGIYRYTSIARPVDPAYPTNKAVLFLLPAGAAGNALLQLAGIGTHTGPGPAAMTGLLVVFGAWALARELAPDDNRAAFLSLALAFVAQLFFEVASFLPLFVALFLTRIVNRTTGKPATLADSALVAGLTVWATFATGQPLLGLVGASAFALDATLPEGRRVQLAGALLCGAASIVATLQSGIGIPPLAQIPTAALVIDTLVISAYIAVTVFTREVTSVCDVYGSPLYPSRVRAGMLIGALLALQTTVTTQDAPLTQDPVTWACLAGVAASGLLSAVTSRGRGASSS